MRDACMYVCMYVWLQYSTEGIQGLVKKSETTLTKVREYFNFNGLMLNTDKTQCIFIGTRELSSEIPSDTRAHVGSTSIVPSTSIKSLGI